MILEWIEFNFVENSLVILLSLSLTSLHKDRFERLLIILQKKGKKKKILLREKSNFGDNYSILVIYGFIYKILRGRGFALTLGAVLHHPRVQVHLKKVYISCVFKPKKRAYQDMSELRIAMSG